MERRESAAQPLCCSRTKGQKSWWPMSPVMARNALCAQSKETGGEAISLAADVSKAGDVDAMVRKTVLYSH